MDGKEEKGGGGGLKSKQWGASEIEINPHSCVSISEFELSKKKKMMIEISNTYAHFPFG